MKTPSHLKSKRRCDAFPDRLQVEILLSFKVPQHPLKSLSSGWLKKVIYRLPNSTVSQFRAELTLAKHIRFAEDTHLLNE